MLSLKSPSSTGMGALVPAEELRDMYQISVPIPQEELGPSHILPYCFFLHFLTPLISDCLNLPFGTRGRSWRQKPFSYKQEIESTERLVYLGGPHKVLLGFTLCPVLSVLQSCLSPSHQGSLPHSNSHSLQPG